MNCKLRRLDLLRGAKMSDCEIHVCHVDQVKKTRCRHKFRCHKIILASASEVFAEKFQDPSFEKNGNIINVEGSPEAYEALLLYIYTYEICNVISLDLCSELMELAKVYKIQDFIDAYIEKISTMDWPIQLILQMFSLANEYNSEAMLNLVGSKILPAATQLFKDNSFLKLNIDELKALVIILKTKEVLSDAELLEALKKYQTCKCIKLNNIAAFQKFVEITNLFGKVLFLADGTLATDKEAKAQSKRPSRPVAIIDESQPKNSAPK